MTASTRRRVDALGRATRRADTVPERATRELLRRLRELVPDPAGSMQPVADLAARVTEGRATAADRAVLAALPAEPLALLGLNADEFMALLHSVEAGC